MSKKELPEEIVGQDPTFLYTVGCGCGIDEIVPFESSGSDARALIWMHGLSKNFPEKTWCLWKHNTPEQTKASLIAYSVAGRQPTLVGPDGVGVPSSQEGYVVTLGTIKKALAVIVNEYGLNKNYVDKIINSKMEEMFNKRFDHWLNNPVTINYLLELVAGTASMPASRLANEPMTKIEILVRDCVRNEISRIVEQGVKIEFNYPSRTSETPTRKFSQ